MLTRHAILKRAAVIGEQEVADRSRGMAKEHGLVKWSILGEVKRFRTDSWSETTSCCTNTPVLAPDNSVRTRS